ncbi:addiction module component, TIGR02574 family [Desulfonatronospira thiodismutans ASO3-1]|uniref:Addiction module component, TIGR02574 family n=1 Tax=Desulfonatronospira thiodismutans ASO3-1 TaxID=555779 RepID=D6SJQ1_9BACT|nr:addiction module protein [Desulfonatronospira thiodismutans]EFI36104.1 addiction module component, TIGR02574 family [Desulfonatronospira thiodismutans ASO3-1]
MVTKEIKEKILALNEVERVRLAEFIFDSLDKPDPEVEQKWIEESERRYQAYKEGRINPVSMNEIRQRYKK